MAPLGGFKTLLRSGFQTPLPPYLSEGDKKEFIDTFMKNGLAAPGRWYEVMVKGLAGPDDASMYSELSAVRHQSLIMLIF